MAIKVATPPEHPAEGAFPDEAGAECYRDFREQVDEVAYLVVQCGEQFFVVAAGTSDDPR